MHHLNAPCDSPIPMHVSLETQVVYQGVDKKFHPEEISSMPLEADGGGHRENYTDESKHEEHR